MRRAILVLCWLWFAAPANAERRPLDLIADDGWIGHGVAYGPYRDGQAPGEDGPTAAQVLEDLTLIQRHWQLLRLYGSDDVSETVLRVIRESCSELKVMLGVWIAAEREDDADTALVAARTANRQQIERGIALAKAYADIVIAVNVGNETQVFWSAHRSPLEAVRAAIVEVRAAVDVPVTTADDFNFWNKPESRSLAEVVDFIVVHAHPLWNGIAIDDAVAWTVATVDSIRTLHPTRLVVLGETGWATRMQNTGQQAELITGPPGEDQQARFLAELGTWIESTRTVTFVFEAFDENWKGGDHPDHVEKHWGLYRADRTPKAYLAERDTGERQ